MGNPRAAPIRLIPEGIISDPPLAYTYSSPSGALPTVLSFAWCVTRLGSPNLNPLLNKYQASNRRLFSSSSPLPCSSSQAMSDTKVEKDYESTSISSAPNGGKVEFYDPSKESFWTRLGLSPESFKRAPGVTGCVESYICSSTSS